MIQDIFPHSLHNHYNPKALPDDRSRIFYFRGNRIFLETGRPSILPFFKELPSEKFTYLFSLDGMSCFLAESKRKIFPEGEWLTLRNLRDRKNLPKEEIFAAWTAGHIQRWMMENRFCGSCGHETVPSPTERARICPHCGRTIYPRLNPAIIAAVVREDKLLLTHYANRPGAHFALVAGYTEIGETIEETVRREVMEETGLAVKNLKYYKSQPWATAADILSGFWCELDGSPDIRVDEIELDHAFWSKREDIILQSDDFSLTNEMMTIFKEGYKPFGK